MRLKLYFLLVLTLSLLFSTLLLAEGEKEIALALKTTGDVEARNPGRDWFTLNFGALLNDNDEIRTGDDGFLAIVFTDDKSQVKIRENTRLTLQSDASGPNTFDKRLVLYVGEIFVHASKQKGAMIINTPDGTASVKGTQFWLLVNDDGTTTLITLEGLVELTSNVTGATLGVSPGSAATISPDGTIQTTPMDEIEVPELPTDSEEHETIELRFEDNDGNVKRVIIELEEDTDD